MHSGPNHARCMLITLAVMVVTPALAVELMPWAQQNALVQKYCAVCHSDVAKNGGLSLEHFDAAQAPPSLTAMLLSKMTGGVSLKTARDALSDPSAAALIDRKTRFGAMGAAGIPIPDKATIDALIRAFTVQSAGATDWSVERSKDAAVNAPTLTVSILREIPSATSPREAEAYRFVASCNLATQEGYLQLAWSPVPQSGTLSATVDGNAAIQYRVAGSEKMGNNSGAVLDHPASLILAHAKRGEPRTGLPFPGELLTITDLFPGESVTFSFSNLPTGARQELTACFPSSNALGGSSSSDSPR